MKKRLVFYAHEKTSILLKCTTLFFQFRRANMRTCLEKLKEIVPLCPDANRHTTLSLLTKAATYIKVMSDRKFLLYSILT